MTSRFLVLPCPGGVIEAEYVHGTLNEAWLITREGQRQKLDDDDLEYGRMVRLRVSEKFVTFREELDFQAAQQGWAA